MAQPAPAARPVRWFNYLAYGSNDVLGAGSMAVISGWVLIFYTQFCGLEAWEAALIFTVARVLDAIASPVIGHLSDAMGDTPLGRRFGRRRFFILAAIPLLPSFAIMWVAGQSFWYYLVTYVLFELVYAMEIIPYETLAAEMGRDYRTKAKFAGVRILFAQASAILAGFLPGMLIGALGKDSPLTFLYMGILFSALFMVTAGLLYRFSWERPAAEVAALRPEGAPALPLARRSAGSTPICSAPSASAPSGCTSACIWAAISARTCSTPPSPSSSSSRWRGRSRPPRRCSARCTSSSSSR